METRDRKGDYAVFTDAAADLPLDFYREYGIEEVPMEYLLGERPGLYHGRSPDREAALEAFYTGLSRAESVSTTQIVPNAFFEAFSPALEEGRDILYCAFSSGMSGTWQNARAAKELLEERYPGRRVRCVDTLSSSAGEGVFALQAALNRKRGMTLEENACWLEDRARRVQHWFLVDDLECLKRGGRISPAVAFFGSKLNIKPILTIRRDGSLEVRESVRGRRQAMDRLVELYKEYEAEEPDGTEGMVFCDCAGCPEDGEALAERVRAAVRSNVLVFPVPLSPIVGAHTGPGMLSVCFFGRPRRS